MAKEKKLVQAITSMDEDFAQWYTDVVKKAELCGYTSVKGCMAIKPAADQGRHESPMQPPEQNLLHDLSLYQEETPG